MATFTSSERWALRFVLGLTQHGWATSHPELTQVIWTNFDFFSEIRPSRIKREKRVKRTSPQHLGYWVVSQEVEFYFRNQLIATVFLTGQLIDKGEILPRHSAWEVCGIRYAWRCDGPEPADWREFHWEPRSLVVMGLEHLRHGSPA